MTNKKFTNPFLEMLPAFRKLRRELPRNISYDAVAFFKDSFKKQGFEDKIWIPWKPRKTGQGSRRGFTSKRQGRATLIKSGALRRSIRPVYTSDEAGAVAGGPKVPYAKIHNEGGYTGRGHKTKIPRRQYMGNSQVFMQEQEKKLFKALDKIGREPFK